ncbi:MAG TPA: PKD domain-containing protein [Bacteroidales bacterium]|nr:PKD domain-containing protein [Bacteroidales bacterium]
MNKELLQLGLILLICSAGCKKESDSVKVVADFTVSNPVSYMNDSVYFENQSVNASGYQWDFGDRKTSYDKNIYHRYTSPGNFKVILTASGPDGKDTASAMVSIKVQEVLKTIYEGRGIKGLTLLEDNWNTFHSVYPSADTVYYSDYVPEYDVYLNQVYNYTEGVVGLFTCSTEKITDSDTLQGLALVIPYRGYTTKSLKLTCRFDDVKEAYGNPSQISDQESMYGYFYLAEGIDFYSYKNDDINIIRQIMVYPPEAKKSASKTGRLTTGRIRGAMRKCLRSGVRR